MNRNASKLAALIVAGSKRLKRVREGDDAIPRTTMGEHARGRIPTLRHAVKYHRALRLRPVDWFVEEGVS